jgi:DNA topoisomerase-1
VLNGRYGPYITDKQKNAKIPKDRDPKTLTLDECKALIVAAPARTFGRWGRKAKAAPKADTAAVPAAVKATAKEKPVRAAAAAAKKKSAAKAAPKKKSVKRKA